MAITRNIIVIIVTITLVFARLSLAENCKSYKFPKKTVYKSCIDLPTLGAHLYWTHDVSTNTNQVAYRATQTPKGWVAWGINPNGTGMVGTQAIIAFQDSKGKMKVYSSKINSYNPEITPESLSFPVAQVSAEYVNNDMIIFARVGPLSNRTSLNIVWQAGNSVKNNVPQMHPLGAQNVKSYRAFDFLSE